MADELRRQGARAHGPAGQGAQPAPERRHRHRGRHGDGDPAAQPERDHQRRAGADRAADAARRGAVPPHHRSGLPDRRHHPGPRRHPQRVQDRPRLGGGAWPRHRRGDPQGSHGDRGHRAAVHGEQGAVDRDHRRPRARQAPRGHRRHPRRERPHRHARGVRAQARRQRPGDPQQPVQGDRAAELVPREHAGDRRRSPGALDAAPRAQGVHRAPPRRGHPPHAVRSARGQGPARDRRGPRPGGHEHRPGDRDHPRLEGHRHRQGAADGRAPGRPRRLPRARRSPRDRGAGRAPGRVRAAVGAPGPGDPRHAARSADRPRAREARGRVPRAVGADRLPRGPARRRQEAHGRDRRRAARDQGGVRRRAPHRDRRRRGRDPVRVAHHRRGHGGDPDPARLRQAHAAQGVPGPGPRWPRHHRRRPGRR